MRLDGSIAKDYEDIAQEVVRNFESLMNGKCQSVQEARNRILDSIPSIITERHNKELFKPIDLDELRKVTFQLNTDKTLGPGGFLAAFFQHFWDIIAQDLHLALEESRKRMTMLGAINHTFLALVLKKKNPKQMGDFRPISLCNSVYKIVTKIIASRLKPLLKKIILDE